MKGVHVRCSILTGEGHVIQKNVFLIDIGSNIGQGVNEVCIISNLLNKFFAIHRLKPFQANYSAPKKIDSFCNCRDKSYNYPLVSYDSSTEMSLAPRTKLHSLSASEHRGGRGGSSEMIQIRALDSLRKDPGSKGTVIIKIVEGHDQEVLARMKDLLSPRQVSAITVEIGFNMEDRRHSFSLEVFDVLTTSGFRFATIRDILRYGKSSDWRYDISIGYDNVIFGARKDLDALFVFSLEYYIAASSKVC